MAIMQIDAAAFRRLVLGETAGWSASLARAVLFLLSLPYSVVVKWRNFAFDRGWKSVIRAGVPVVSVGNLTVGGTGKTPTVEYLARWFRQRNVRVAVLSRGYGSADGPNDEALLLEENLPDVPHLQGADRARLARMACMELGSQLLILDDGFQHRRLHRDLDIVLLDATNPFGAGRQLPAGLLRESVRSLLRANLVILTRCDVSSGAEREEVWKKIETVTGAMPRVEVNFAPVSLIQHSHADQPPTLLSGLRVIIFSGIGNPGAFAKTVAALNAVIGEERVFPDHHSYRPDDLRRLSDWVRRGRPDAVVTTQKDLVKLRVATIAGVPLYAIRIGVRFHAGEEVLSRMLENVVGA